MQPRFIFLACVVCVATCASTTAPGSGSDFDGWLLGINAALAVSGIGGLIKLAILVQKLATQIEHLQNDHVEHKNTVKELLKEAKEERAEIRRGVSGNPAVIHGENIPRQW